MEDYRIGSGKYYNFTGCDAPCSQPITALLSTCCFVGKYSSTPGGTLFSTTPGGTRIIYDRKFLLQCRTSPLTRTPPNLPDIPGVTTSLKLSNSRDTNPPEQRPREDAQFEMDI
uniref:Eukaryotic translation initiation factor 4E-binding protein 1-like n=1 Tax=Mastacembelus armatus TaxID=205130 RepID=A0A7N9AV05_9TELE